MPLTTVFSGYYSHEATGLLWISWKTILKLTHESHGNHRKNFQKSKKKKITNYIRNLSSFIHIWGEWPSGQGIVNESEVSNPTGRSVRLRNPTSTGDLRAESDKTVINIKQ